MILPRLKIFAGAVIKLFPAVGAADNPGEHIALSRPRRAAFVPAQLLNSCKGVPIYDGLVGVLEYDPLLRRVLDFALVFVRLPMGLEVHHSSEVLLLFQYAGNGTRSPMVWIVGRLGGSVSALFHPVNGGAVHLGGFQLLCDLRRTKAIHHAKIWRTTAAASSSTIQCFLGFSGSFI